MGELPKSCKHYEFKHWIDETLHCEIWDGKCNINDNSCMFCVDATQCPKYETKENENEIFKCV